MVRVYLIASILLQVGLYGADKVPPRGNPTSLCDKALEACLKLSEAQDASITNLKASNKELADRLADATKPPLLPTWAIITISVLTGAMVGGILSNRR